MTDQTNAELIAEARDIWEADDLYPDQMIPRLVKALEAAEQRADLADADLEVEQQKNAGYRSRNDALAAVVEKVREWASGQASEIRTRYGRTGPAGYLGFANACEDILDILATAPADTLREVRAEAWQEGAYRVYNSTLDEAEWWWSDWVSENPYKAREEKP